MMKSVKSSVAMDTKYRGGISGCKVGTINVDFTVQMLVNVQDNIKQNCYLIIDTLSKFMWYKFGWIQACTKLFMNFHHFQAKCYKIMFSYNHVESRTICYNTNCSTFSHKRLEMCTYII